MNRKTWDRALLMVALFAPIMAAQGVRTTFLPGLGAGNHWWTREATVTRLQQQVNLGPYLLFNPGSTSAIGSQSDNVAAQLTTNLGEHVLVGHSIGGIVARSAARATPGSTRGILSIGSPHQGALVASNGQKLISYFTWVIMAAVDGFAGMFPGLSDLLSVFVYGQLEGAVKATLTSYTPVNSAAAFDVRAPSSGPYANDVPVPGAAIGPNNLPFDPAIYGEMDHANIYGVIERRFAWAKVAASALNGTPAASAEWQQNYQKTQAIFKKCKLVKYFIILRSTARKCGHAYNALATVDERWQFFTAGGNYPSDGFIGNDATRYPGTALSNPINFPVVGVDHNALVSDQRAIDRMAEAMKARLRMVAP